MLNRMRHGGSNRGLGIGQGGQRRRGAQKRGTVRQPGIDVRITAYDSNGFGIGHGVSSVPGRAIFLARHCVTAPRSGQTTGLDLGALEQDV